MLLREDIESGPPRWEEGFRAWRVTRYDDVRLVLSDERFTREVRRAAAVRAERGLPPLPDRRVGRGATLLDCDPPRHAELRRSVNFGFVPRRVERVRPWIERAADDLYADLRARGEAELSGEFATPLAAAGMCRLVGLPAEDLDRFAPWVREVHEADPTPEGGRRVVAAIEAMDGYIEHVIDERRHREQEQDLLGAMITATDEGTGLDEDDLVGMVRSILVGGYESTAALMTTGMLRLLTEPGLFTRLRANPERLPAFVEDLLRADPPFPRVQERYPLLDVEVGGVLIPRGEPVVADLAAANRDPAAGERNHLAFGPGIHHCLGAALARMEARVALQVLLRTLPRPEPASPFQDLARTPGILAGPSALPVRFGPVIHLDLTQLSMVLVHLVVFAVIFVESGVLVGLVLPGDSVLFMSGLLAGRSGSSVVLLVVLVFIAAVAGDSVGYRIGRVVGRRAVERRPRLLARAQDLYRRHGWFAVVIARWYPWIRTVMPLLAGMGRMPYPGFLAANALGAVLWGCGTVLLGYFAHSIPGLYQASLVLMGLAILATLGYLVRQRMIAANSDCLRRGSDRNLPAR